MATNSLDNISAPGVADATTPEREQDVILPAFFLSGAAALLAVFDPLYLNFETHVSETWLLTGAAIALLWLGVLLRRNWLLYVGVAAVLAVILFEVGSQPAPLNAPVVLIWPLRLTIVMLVGISWALLMQPRPWLRRAVFGVAVPTLLVLTAWGGPALGAVVFGWRVPLPVTNFTPYWLAIDSTNRLYSGAFTGGLVWVFDNSGSPQGTLRPARAPQPPTPGPGILPNGMEEEITRSGAAPGPSPTPTAVRLPSTSGEEGEEGGGVRLNFCGVAVGTNDHLYTLSNVDLPLVVDEFDADGNIIRKIPFPIDESPAVGCLALDKDYLYISANSGKIFVFTHDGHRVRQLDVPFAPGGMAARPGHELVLVYPDSLVFVNADTGATTTRNLRALPGQENTTFADVVVEAGGTILVADPFNYHILRLDADAQQILATIGTAGNSPGQFAALGALALDSQGRIYASDWRNRVIQRFTADGKIDAVWWAAKNSGGEPGENEP